MTEVTVCRLWGNLTPNLAGLPAAFTDHPFRSYPRVLLFGAMNCSVRAGSLISILAVDLASLQCLFYA